MKPSIDVIEVQLDDPYSGDSGGARQEYGTPGAPMVNNSENGIMTSNWG